MSGVRTVKDGAIARITLARPEQKNALDRSMVDAIGDAVRKFDADPDVRVIVVAADGDDFCAGADLSALRQLLGAPLAVQEEDARALGNTLLALHECKRPTIAVVQGRALAGGAGLASACDVVLAHETAVFGYPEVKIGFVPAIVMAFLVRSVGEKHAFELVATGRTVVAHEALQLGLVSRVLRAENFAALANEFALAIGRTPPEALSATKSLLYKLRGMNTADGVNEGVRVNAEARMGAEFRSGIERFFARGK